MSGFDLLAGPRSAASAHEDMDRSAALLADVAAGRRGPTARVLIPRPTLAFGRLDMLAAGFEAARRRAGAAGFEPVRRLGGGRAAAYHEGSVLVELFTPQATIATGIEERFGQMTDLLVGALGRVGVAAQVGEMPGEFCPGRFSVHAAGIKLAGTAQRSIRGASLTAAFVSVEGGDALRDVLVDVYDALALPWDPATAGGVADLLGGTTAAEVAATLSDGVAALSARC